VKIRRRAQRVEAAFFYYAGLSYRRFENEIIRLSETVRQRYHILAYLFNPDADHHSTIAIDKTKLKIEETEVYVWQRSM
jgi:transposase-like protein